MISTRGSRELAVGKLGRAKSTSDVVIDPSTRIVKSLIFDIMKTLPEITTILNSHKQRLFSHYPLKSIAVFGSYARNQQNDESDVDILVEFNDRIGIRFIDLAEEIESLLGTKVDLISRNAVKPEYFKSIESDLKYV